MVLLNRKYFYLIKFKKIIKKIELNINQIFKFNNFIISNNYKIFKRSLDELTFRIKFRYTFFHQYAIFSKFVTSISNFTQIKPSLINL